MLLSVHMTSALFLVQFSNLPWLPASIGVTHSYSSRQFLWALGLLEFYKCLEQLEKFHSAHRVMVFCGCNRWFVPKLVSRVAWNTGVPWFSSNSPTINHAHIHIHKSCKFSTSVYNKSPRVTNQLYTPAFHSFWDLWLSNNVQHSTRAPHDVSWQSIIACTITTCTLPDMELWAWQSRPRWEVGSGDETNSAASRSLGENGWQLLQGCLHGQSLKEVPWTRKTQTTAKWEGSSRGLLDC